MRSGRHSHAFVVVCVLIDVYLVFLILRSGGFVHDSYAYWSVNLADPYTANVGERDAFLYSPAVAQVFAVLGLLPWPVFLLGWTVLQVGIVLWLSGRSWWWVLPLPPVLFECIVGNVHLLYAAAINLGFRFPWTWALMLLTKVTPGVGLLWFAVRREWRALGIALGATAVIVAVSYVLAPRPVAAVGRPAHRAVGRRRPGARRRAGAARGPGRHRGGHRGLGCLDRPTVGAAHRRAPGAARHLGREPVHPGGHPAPARRQGPRRAAQVPRSSRAWYRA